MAVMSIFFDISKLNKIFKKDEVVFYSGVKDLIKNLMEIKE